MNKAQKRSKKRRQNERLNQVEYHPDKVLRWSMFAPEEQKMISKVVEAPFKPKAIESTAILSPKGTEAESGLLRRG